MLPDLTPSAMLGAVAVAVVTTTRAVQRSRRRLTMGRQLSPLFRFLLARAFGGHEDPVIKRIKHVFPYQDQGVSFLDLIR